MTRRRVQETREPIGRITLEDFMNYIHETIDALSDKEVAVLRMRFGIEDGEPKTLTEVARALGIERTLARELEAKAISKLRHPARFFAKRQFLTESLGDDFGWIPEGMREAILGISLPKRRLAFCERHGWTFPAGRNTCEQCPCYIEWRDYDMGRPRQYCSNSCRQAAYRSRKKVAGRTRVTGGAAELLPRSAPSCSS